MNKQSKKTKLSGTGGLDWRTPFSTSPSSASASLRMLGTRSPRRYLPVLLPSPELGCRADVESGCFKLSYGMHWWRGALASMASVHLATTCQARTDGCTRSTSVPFVVSPLLLTTSYLPC